MRFISIDLEFEQNKTNHQSPDSFLESGEKIIQMGYVAFEITSNPTPNILQQGTVHLHYPQPLSQFIKTLTSIEDEDCQSSIYTATDALLILQSVKRQYECSRQLIQWGGGDDISLLKESIFSSLNGDLGFASSSINVKHLFQAYALANNIEQKGGLSKSMGKIGISFPYTKYNGKQKGTHWAETDALATAIIYNKLINLMRK